MLNIPSYSDSSSQDAPDEVVGRRRAGLEEFRRGRRRRRVTSKMGYALAAAALGAVTSSAMAQTNQTPLPVCTSYAGQATAAKTVTVPAVGIAQSTEVGGVMLTTFDATIAEAGLQIDKEASFTGRYAGQDFTVTLPAGPTGAALVPGPGYAMPTASFRYARESGDRHGFSKPDISISSSRDATMLTAHIRFGLIARDYPVVGVAFTQERCLRTPPNSLRREILYSGAAKGALTLTYREFVGDLARPDFTQEATFDLSQGNDIGFKGARIRIVKASNVGLDYVVLKAFDG